MPVKKPVLVMIFMVLWLGAVPVFTQESTQAEGNTAEDPQLETLLYGIDSDVLTVLASLQSDKISRYNEVLLTVADETRDTDILRAIYRLWDDTDFTAGLPRARSEIAKVLNDEDFDKPVVLEAISFLSHQKDSVAAADLYEMAQWRDTSLAAAAVRAVGNMKDSTAPEILLERLKTEDPVAQDDLVASLIVALGELQYRPAADELVLIAEDSGSPPAHRRFACISLGRIGRDEDYAVVERLYFEAEDANLRSYALAGLAEFTQFDSVDVLVQALKRDSYWRIRVTAAEKLLDKGSEEIERLLKYKAVSDPVSQVKIASLKTIGSFGTGSSRTFLLDFFKERRNSAELRLACLSVLVANKVPRTIDAVQSVMDDYWEKDEARFLEFLCRDLSRLDWNRLSPLYARMLEHPNWLMQVYGIRGIRRNNLGTLAAKVQSLDRDGTDGRVRREIQAVKLPESDSADSSRENE